MFTSQRTPVPGAPRHRAASRVTMSRRRWVAGVLTVILGAGAVVVSQWMATADATTRLVVNSTAWGGPDANPGNKVCETAPGNGVCTLMAAVQESNAINGAPGAVEITVDPSIPIGTFMGSGQTGDAATPNHSGNFMLNTQIDAGGADNNGAQYVVTAPVTIDLGHQLKLDASINDDSENAMFYLNGPDIQVLNADQVLSSGSSFVVGPNANRVAINGDTMGLNGGFAQISTPTFYPERFVVFREGASNVTVSNYQVTGYYDNPAEGGLFIFDSYAPYTPMTNIVIDNVQALYSSGSNCSGSDGSGCRTRVTNFWKDQSTDFVPVATTINGLTFQNMLIKNMTGQYAFRFSAGDNNGGTSATISNLTMRNNVFTNNQGNGGGPSNAFVLLPYNKHLLGTSTISDNVFTRPTSGTNDFAIYYYGDDTIGNGGSPNPTFASGLTISDNYFNGYTTSTIRTERSGLVTVSGNTFGPATASQGAPGTSEEWADSPTMYNTFHGAAYGSNQGIRTWAPSAAATVLSGPLPAGVLPMSAPASQTLPTCPATVDVSKITATDNNTQVPGSPVTLQAYWTATNDADIYLGQVSGVSGTSATVEVPLPVGTVTLPDGTTETPVNASTGAASGYIRFQTQVEGMAQLESSQYSRFVAVSGTCTPVLTLSQADGMTDPTSGRDLHFTLTSTIPLDPSSVNASDITLKTSTVSQTLNASLLNPRIVSITPVDGSDNMSFDVIARVDDSATVSVSLAVGTVSATNGLSNTAAASGADKSITFINPVQVNPATFTLVTGEPKGKSFTLSLAAGAPVPTSDLAFTATVSQPADTPDVTLSTNNPILPAGADSAPPVTVKAAAGDVTANTPVSIALSLASADTNYDGLLVPSVSPYLFSTDPTIQITKTAYVSVNDTSTPAQIQATGTLAASGSRLLDGQTVCFVYTVTNTSADDWATALSNIVVSDTDTRLGKDGVIGTIGTLPIGASQQLAACTSIAPADTTTGSASASAGQS